MDICKTCFVLEVTLSKKCSYQGVSDSYKITKLYFEQRIYNKVGKAQGSSARDKYWNGNTGDIIERLLYLIIKGRVEFSWSEATVPLRP